MRRIALAVRRPACGMPSDAANDGKPTPNQHNEECQNNEPEGR